MGKCLEQALAFCVPLQCLASKMEQYYYISLVALAQAGIWVASHDAWVGCFSPSRYLSHYHQLSDILESVH